MRYEIGAMTMTMTMTKSSGNIASRVSCPAVNF